MDDALTTLKNSPFTCPWCKEQISPRDENCSKCGYPLKGTEHDQERFRIQREIYLQAKYAKRRKVYGGIFVLFLLMGICFICGIVGFFARDNYSVTWLPKVIVFLSAAVVLLPVSLFSRKKPVLCFIIGAIVIIAGAIAL